MRCLRLGLLALAIACGDSALGTPVHPDAESVRPLAPGASVPDVAVRGVNGEAVSLASLVSERGALLVFYRGGW